MYRPPLKTGIQTFEASHHHHEREDAIVRRQHREHIAAERARERDKQHAPETGAHRIGRPAAAFWAFVSLRR